MALQCNAVGFQAYVSMKTLMFEGLFPAVLCQDPEIEPYIVKVTGFSITPLRAMVPWLNDHSGDRDADGFLKHDKPWVEALQCRQDAEDQGWVINGLLCPSNQRIMPLTLWDMTMKMDYYELGAAANLSHSVNNLGGQSLGFVCVRSIA